MTGTAADHLAAAVQAARTAGPEVFDAAADVFLDTLGVMAAGSGRAEHTALGGLTARPGGASTVIGAAHPVAPADAVFLNATTPTVYQLDEGYRVSRGHPGIHVVPAVWALAEDLGASGGQLLAALVVGYEVAARVGRGFGGVVPDIHPHGNWGALGAAAGAAWLWSGGDARVVSTAIDGAAALALSPDRRATTAGAGVHHLFAAAGAHTGFLAAGAAVAGMTAVPGSLEDFLLRRSAADPDRSIMTAPAPGRWAVQDSYVKFWPSCAHTHTAVGALLELLGRNPLRPADIDRIEVDAFRAAAGLAATVVDNELAARYSIPYVVATAVVRGGFGFTALDGDTVHDPAVRALATRVIVRHDPALDDGYPAAGRPLRLTVHTRDGRRLTAHGALSHGDPESPANSAEIRSKAHELLALRFDAAAAGRVLAAADSARAGAPIAVLGDALRSAASTPPASASGERAR